MMTGLQAVCHFAPRVLWSVTPAPKTRNMSHVNMCWFDPSIFCKIKTVSDALNSRKNRMTPPLCWYSLFLCEHPAHVYACCVSCDACGDDVLFPRAFLSPTQGRFELYCRPEDQKTDRLFETSQNLLHCMPTFKCHAQKPNNLLTTSFLPSSAPSSSFLGRLLLLWLLWCDRPLRSCTRQKWC